ncbi:membrane protein-like protein [Thioalkalivibrio nitratireducens DSM 14787]|uniref:Membrane protein-like protein n=1 Tax=Thioalkalivibrio nitratireducens (strain DSM 14787 / UNIQEM 213 / ALEN2) TaxID=1255043 RepID=L0E164_THIND|nr:YhdP family protein [Thioalkalivibrio nitratireducens]AGA35043.1 membrane protein-like protein [Thioalkalivibrio nitratireducens DSM 14787]
MRRGLRAVVPAIALVLALLSLLLLTLRLVLPHSDALATGVERLAGTWIDRDVRVESLQLSWSGWVPELVAREVRIEVPDGIPLQAREVGITLAPLRSLRARRPVPGEVRLSGVDLRVERDADGMFSAHGWQFGGQRPLALDWQRHFRELGRVGIAEASLQWVDAGHQLHAGVQVDTLDLQADGSGLRAVGRGRLLAEAGGRVYLGLEAPLAGARPVEFYLEAEDLQLDYWGRMAGAPADLVGASSVKVWGSLEDGRVRRLQGEHDTRVLLAHGDGRRIHAFGHRFQWRRMDRKAVAWWSARTPGAGDARLEYRLTGDGPERAADRIALSAAGIALGPYARIADRLHPEAVPGFDVLAALQPSGDLHSLQVLLTRDEAGWRLDQVEADAVALKLSAHEAIPGFAGLDASLDWADGRGTLALDSTGLELALPRWYGAPLRLDRLRAQLDVRRDPAAWHLTISDFFAENPDAAAEGEGRIEFGEQPQLDLALRFLRADGSRVAPYLPEYLLPPQTYQWLADSIRDATLTGGGMVYRGNPRDFPFRGGEGTFLLRAGIDDGRLDYQPGWPAAEGLTGTLVFHNASFRAENVSGRILDTAVDDTEVTIADMQDQPTLEIRGQASGPVDDLPDYLRQAGIDGGFGRYRDELRPGGDSELDLELRIPLHGDGPAATEVAGSLRIEGALLEVPEVPLRLQQLSGEVRFGPETGIRGQGIRAVVHGEPVVIDLERPAGAGAVQVRASGRQPLAPWVGEQAWLAQVRGTADWRADIRLDDAGDSLLELTTDLEGVEIDWPPPLAKTRGTRRPLSIVWPLGPAAGDLGQIRFDGVLAADMRLLPAPGAGPGTVRAIALQLGQPLPARRPVPETGIELDAQLASVDVGAWLQVLESLAAGSAPVDATDDLRLRRAEIDVTDSVRWGSLTMPGLRLRLEPVARGQWLALDGDWLRGQAWIEPAGAAEDGIAGRGHWRIALERLQLDRLPEPGNRRPPRPEGLLADPRQWPAVDLTADDLRLGELRFADLDLRLLPEPEGLEVLLQHLGAPEGGVALSGDGRWTVSPDGEPATEVAIEARGDDWGAGLAAIGVSRALEQGTGVARFQLAWPGPLHAPDPATLQGRVELDLADGALRDVDPGAGRLLGLVSLDVIPRRLRLDFRDVYTQGLIFDQLAGDATIDGGDLLISGLRIGSPSAVVRVSGRTGLVARDFDQSIVVVPRLRSTLPIVGALVGGPVAGVVVLLVERALGIGDQVEEAARVEYYVTGPWSNPVVRARVRTEQDLVD